MRAVTRNPKHAPIDVVRKWTIALGVLTAGNMTKAEADMKLRAYVPVLHDQFPAGAFTQASLAAVARQCKWFPSYHEVVMHLSAYWREHRPLPALLPPPPPIRQRGEPTPDEIAHVKRVVAELTASLNAHADKIDGAVQFKPGAKHLSPGMLDQINPLPNGRRRTDVESTTTTATSEAGHDYAADNAEAVAARDDGEADAPEWFDDGIPNWP